MTGAPERRACKRFVVPGSTVDYRKTGLLASKTFSGPWPVADISRGGVRFLCQDLLGAGVHLLIKILVPDSEESLLVRGSVKWVSTNPEKSYRYEVGIQFDPYGEKKDGNDPEMLRKIVLLEQKYLAETPSPEL